MYKSLIMIWIAASLAACSNNDEAFLPRQLGDMQPAHFPAAVYDNPANPITEPGFLLGRRLFFDPELSRDRSLSCASCHHQAHAFADFPERQLSPGIENRHGIRHTPALFNLQWLPEYMWDGGINHLDIMPLGPLVNVNEMDISLAEVIARLQNSNSYRQDFKAAFGSEEINSQRFFWALSQYMRSLVSADSPYDRYLLGKETLPQEALQGLALFETHCASCHTPPLFSNYTYQNNGLNAEFSADEGRAHITGFPQDSGLFKVPSLRNIAHSPPYFHDGRAATLAEVLQHYSQGVQASSTLSPHLPVGGLQLSASQQSQIIAFLNSLSDETFLTNPLLSE